MRAQAHLTLKPVFFPLNHRLLTPFPKPVKGLSWLCITQARPSAPTNSCPLFQKAKGFRALWGLAHLPNGTESLRGGEGLCPVGGAGQSHTGDPLPLCLLDQEGPAILSLGVASTEFSMCHLLPPVQSRDGCICAGPAG